MRWLIALTELVVRKPLVIYRFSQEEWESLDYAKRIREFTVAREHSLTEKTRAPSVGILTRKASISGPETYIGLVKSRARITTLDSRIGFAAVRRVQPSTEDGILNLVTDPMLKGNLRRRLSSKELVIPLSPKLSEHLVKRLAAINENHDAMRAVMEQLDSPRTYSSNFALQHDAVDVSLKAFGLSASAPALLVDLVDHRKTALNRVETRYDRESEGKGDEIVKVHEDSVVEHDAREVTGFSLIESDITGRAVFRNGDEHLEIVTANRRPLEEVFGVDLIYLNAVKKNIVMVQYKMLEQGSNGNQSDWIYYPDSQLEAELTRMKHFSQMHLPGQLEYRINPQVFYLRFVRRDATLGRSPVTIPVDHFNILRQDSGCKGPKGAFRITYDTLDGKYLRQEGFLGLLRAGYIGAYARTSADLACLIRAVLNDGHAVVRAIHEKRPED